MAHSKHKRAFPFDLRSSDTRWFLFSFVALLVFLICTGVWWYQRGHRASGLPIGSDEVVQNNSLIDPLTGRVVSEVRSGQQVFGVMIDEHVDARPQSGIDQAFLVFEAPVEAGIPRLLAFFTEDQSVEKIGPVRSARPYFIDWARELDALYVHVGGSPEALQKISQGTLSDLNQFWHDAQFWRSGDRDAPHNVYTSIDRLRAYVDRAKLPDPLYGTWLFSSNVDVVGDPALQFSVEFLRPEYVFSWKYNEESSNYERSFGSQPMTTLESAPLVAQNILVMVSDVEVVDAVGRRHIRTTGEGEAVLFQRGVKQSVVWKKASDTDRLRFYYQDGSEVVFLPGATWVEVLPSMSRLSIKKLSS